MARSTHIEIRPDMVPAIRLLRQPNLTPMERIEVTALMEVLEAAAAQIERTAHLPSDEDVVRARIAGAMSR